MASALRSNAVKFGRRNDVAKPKPQTLCCLTSTTTTTTAALLAGRRANVRPGSNSTAALRVPSKSAVPSPSSAPPRARSAAASVRAAAALRNIDAPQALLFDCDGVLLESEAVGHRNSFNAAFKEEEALRPDEHEW